MTLIAREHAYTNPVVSVAIGLPARSHFMLFCEDEEDGSRWTAIGTDRKYWEMVVFAAPNVRADLTLNPLKFPLKRSGWPDEWPESLPVEDAQHDRSRR